MTRSISAALAVVTLLCAPAYAQDAITPAQPTRFSAGVSAGFYSGFGIEISGTFSNFARGFPLAARAALGWASVDPGSAVDARRIFINDATNGAPEKSGRILSLRFDGMYRLTGDSATPAFLVFGPRYSSFNGNFRFVGGNEDFNIGSRQWGLGLGLEGQFAMGRSGTLVVAGGVDYFFDAELRGHDTAYTPSGDDSNPRRGYTFEDADAAINQPRWVPRLMVGYSYRF